ncbi:MBL fold metallo-hydrolase [Gammaproteobacteria bacterium AB-CW1]|uniref:MBL fold metallo-hydrolase n=1 Tax=Natronospira elongata TaxID=3110268 RepID=A0AAP6JD45_9GAMM|nr:MBL fold metallo-hydrolase [Gammaproteobacteria bacterium AB-CW1]
MSTFRFAFLGSGSRGNALLVEAAGRRVLVDCGFSARETARRMAGLNLEPGQLDAILVTHEHADHASGVVRLARRHGLPVFTTHGTRAAVGDGDDLDWRLISSHEDFFLGKLAVTPVAVPHDAREPVQFILGDGQHRLGLLTDLGHVTPHVVRCYSGCQALVLEANHDRAMLASGPYPPALKRRVGGDFGHLNNEQSAAFLDASDMQSLERLIAAHISEKNNDADLARDTLADGIGWSSSRVEVAVQDSASDWYEL